MGTNIKVVPRVVAQGSEFRIEGETCGVLSHHTDEQQMRSEHGHAFRHVAGHASVHIPHLRAESDERR